MRTLLILICLLLSWSAARAENAEFKLLKTITAVELTAILNEERAEFLETAVKGSDYVLPATSAASNDVALYTVYYGSTAPELGGKKIRASGLLAVPVNAGQSGNASIPLIAYLHGTVFGKYDVPSFAFRKDNPTGYPHYKDAYETRYMVALFAGNGYAVMAPDYFGMGAGASENEGYMIKRSTAQGSYDLYLDSMKFLRERNIAASSFMVSGWSQGGLNTTGFLQLLEEKGVDVRAAFTAASPNDPYALVNTMIFHHRPLDPPWGSAVFGLLAFSCENYLGPDGLAKDVLDPKYYAEMKSVYERTYAEPDQLLKMLGNWATIPFVNFLRPAYRDPAAFARSSFGQCVTLNETYRREFKTPLRMYYGMVDEVIRPKVGLIGYDYQQSITTTPGDPSSSRIEAFPVEGADHRLTFISASVAAKAWLDAMQ